MKIVQKKNKIVIFLSRKADVIYSIALIDFFFWKLENWRRAFLKANSVLTRKALRANGRTDTTGIILQDALQNDDDD